MSDDKHMNECLRTYYIGYASELESKLIKMVEGRSENKHVKVIILD